MDLWWWFKEFKDRRHHWDS